MKVLSRTGGAEHTISLLVNQVRNANEGKVVHGRISKVAKQFLTVSVLDAGYMVARPHVTVNSSLGADRRTIRADQFIVKLGMAYSIF